MSQSKWIELKSFPFYHPSQLLSSLNDNEFMTVSTKVADWDMYSEGIYKYNALGAVWIKIISYEKELVLQNHSATYDPSEQIIFIVDHAFFQTKFINIKWTQSAMTCNFGLFKPLACSKNEDYIIGFCERRIAYELRNNYFVIYNLKLKTFSKSTFECELRGNFRAIMMSNEQRDELMVFAFINTAI